MSDSSVFQNLRKRLRQRESPDLSGKPLSTALVVQGGAMRGIATCGACAALNELGLTDAFDSVYAVSSGALNGAYFLAGQAALGVTVYAEDFPSGRYLNRRRFWKTLDLDLFFKEIIQGSKAHDTAALQRSETELVVIASDKHSGEAVHFNSNDHLPLMYQALKASCALPVMFPKGVTINGRALVDGYLNGPVPLQAALVGRHTDILVLLSGSEGARPTRPNALRRLVLDSLIRMQLGPGAFDRYKSRAELAHEALEIAATGRYQHDDGTETRIAVIGPDVETATFELGRDKLEASALSAWSKTMARFGDAERPTEEHFRQVLEEARVSASAA